MGDWSNLHLTKEAADSYLQKGDKISALIEYYWYTQLCEHGEFTIGVDDFNENWRKAEEQLYKLGKELAPVLSKSTFLLGTQCKKYLWLYRNRYREQVVSPETQVAFNRGHIIGELAQKLFPQGIDVNDSYNYSDTMYIDQCKHTLPFSLRQLQRVNYTAKKLNEPVSYEAAFIFNKVYSAIDILTHENGKRIAYEVKSTTEIRDVYIEDCALQYYVMSNNIKLDDFFLVYIDEEYLNEINMPLAELTIDNCDINRLFIQKSIMNEVLKLQGREMKRKISRCKKVLKNRRFAPEVCMGKQCNNPYECHFKYYCEKKE